MIDIRTYGKKKNSTTTTSSGGGFANYAPTQSEEQQGTTTEVNGVYLWGQYHDHTSDVNGDMSVNGRVSATTVNATNGTISHLTSTDITTQGLTTDELEAIRGIITSLTSEDIYCENLTVTKAAHFFKLIIDEVKAAQGQVILTPANATIDKVSIMQNGDYKCYFKATDGDKNILQCFEINDQLICQTFNVADGVSYDVSNKYYWRLVTNVSSTPEQVSIDGTLYDCHWFILSDTDKDQYSNAAPEVGDEVVLLGNRNDTTRQAAISIGAYDNPFLDTTIRAPFIVQYDGINNYTLASHRKNVISRQLNHLTASNVTGNNMLNTSKWINADMTPCAYDREYFNYSTTATEDISGNTYYDAFSPIIYVDAGNYTFSYYTEFQPTVSIRYSANETTNPLEMNTYITPTASGTVPNDTYADNPRKYVTFNVEDNGYICITMGLQDYAEDNLFAKPQLEWGTETTAFDDSAAYTQSQILMTKDEIDISLADAGINIQGDNVTITGNLRATDDSWYFLKDGISKVGGWHVDEDNLFSDKGISNGQETTYINQADFKPNVKLDGTNALISINGENSDLQIGHLDIDSAVNVEFTKARRQIFGTSDVYEDYLSNLSIGESLTINNLFNGTLNLEADKTHTLNKLTYRYNHWSTPNDGRIGKDFLITNNHIRIYTTNNALFEGDITKGNNRDQVTVTYNTALYPNVSVTSRIIRVGDNNQIKDQIEVSITFTSTTITDDTINIAATPTYKYNSVYIARNPNDSYHETDITTKVTGRDTSTTNTTSVISDKGIKFVQNNASSRLQFNGTQADMVVNGRGLTVNNARTKQVINSVEYPLTKINASMRYGNVEVGKYDEFIVIDTNTSTALDLTQTDACYDGHVLIVKALNGQAIQVSGTCCDYDSSTTTTTKSWNDTAPRKFIYLSGVWYICKMG